MPVLRFMSSFPMKMTAAYAGLCCLLGLTVFPAHVAGNPHSKLIGIGAGRLNSAEWISTLAHKGGAGPSVVCVSTSLAVKRKDGVGISEAAECGSARDNAPFIQFIGDHSRNGARSVFVSILTPAARKVVVDLGKGSGSQVRLKRVSKSKARKLRIEQVGYWVHAFSGPVCIQRMIVYDERGYVLSDGKFGC